MILSSLIEKIFYIVEHVFVFFFLLNFNPAAQRVTLGGQLCRYNHTQTYLNLTSRLLALATKWEGLEQSAWAPWQETMFPRRAGLPCRSPDDSRSVLSLYPGLLGSWVGRGICATAVSESTGSRPACQSEGPQWWDMGSLSCGGTVMLKLLSVYNLNKVRPPWELSLAIFIPLSPVQCCFNYQSMLQSLPLYLNILKYYSIVLSLYFRSVL